MATRVGVRELRQNLSVYLRRVAGGERFVVTDRREPVAELVPLRELEDGWERLIAEGRMTRATGDLLAVEPLPAVPPGSPTLSELLEEQREERLG